MQITRRGIAALAVAAIAATTGGRAGAGVIDSTAAGSAEPRIVYYATAGSVGDGAAGVVDFRGIESGTLGEGPVGAFYTPGTVSLGDFRVKRLPAGTSRTLTNVPFEVVLRAFDGVEADSAYADVKIDGWICGTLSAGSTSALVATVSSVVMLPSTLVIPPIRAEELTVLTPQAIAPANGLPVVTTTLYAYTSSTGEPTPIPEPSVLATLAAGGALVLVRRSRRRRD